jgi:hypothetical protein
MVSHCQVQSLVPICQIKRWVVVKGRERTLKMQHGHASGRGKVSTSAHHPRLNRGQMGLGVRGMRNYYSPGHRCGVVRGGPVAHYLRIGQVGFCYKKVFAAWQGWLWFLSLTSLGEQPEGHALLQNLGKALDSFGYQVNHSEIFCLFWQSPPNRTNPAFLLAVLSYV